MTRQAVHNWHKRGTLPRWLALACAGHDLRAAQERYATEPARLAQAPSPAPAA